MAAQIKESFGIDPELIPSSGGCFEVVADGKKVFSKLDQGRFPEADELIQLIEPVAGA